jgi:transketolase
LLNLYLNILDIFIELLDTDSMNTDNELLKKTAWERRLKVAEMVFHSKSGHIGGSFSCMDILTVLYDAVMDREKIKRGDADRDRFVLSKGHCAEALYTVLASHGFFPKEELDTFGAFDTRLPEHPMHRLPGVEISTGALGHGIAAAVGMAYGLKAGQPQACVYALLGDGELAEGSVWEAAMAAAKFDLDNLTAVIDRNGMQISGLTEEVMPLEGLAAKFSAFGWAVSECNGHEPAALLSALKTPHPGRPLAVIASTVKGYGTKVLEGNPDNHHMIPTEEQYKQIREDLHLRMREGEV